MSSRPLGEAEVVTVVRGQTCTLPPRSSCRVAARPAALTVEPLVTTAPPTFAAVFKEPSPVGSSVVTSPTRDCAHAETAAKHRITAAHFIREILNRNRT